MNKKIKSRKGFTLIELIVVIAILGILAAIAIPRFTGTQERARERAHSANESMLRSSANICLAEHGAPSDNVIWTANESGEASGGSGVYSAADYVDDWPASPWTGGSAYSVTLKSDGSVTVTGGGKS